MPKKTVFDSDKLLLLMAELHVTQTQLAKDTGLHINTINRIVNGDSRPVPTTIALMARALGCKASDLKSEKEPTK